MKIVFCIWILILNVNPSHAFDPLSIAGAVQGVAGLIDGASEVSESANAFSELYTEIDGSAEMTEEGKRLVEDIEEVKSLAAEAGYSNEQINSLIKDDQTDVTRLCSVLRKLTQILHTSKGVLKTISRLSGKSQASQIGGNETEKQMLKLQYSQIAHERRLELAKKKEVLREKVERKRWIDAQEKQIEHMGGMKWGKIGFYSFPGIDPKFQKALEIAHQYKHYVFGLLLLVFALKSGWIGATLGGAEQYGKLLSTLFVFGVWTAAAPLLIKIILEQSHILSGVITHTGAQALIPSEPMPKVSGWMDIYNALSWAFHLFKIYAFQITEFIFNCGLVMMIAIVYIVIFLTTMLNVGMSMATYFNIIIALSLWPLLWNLIGVLAQQFMVSDKLSAADSIYSVLLTVLQILSPVIGYKILRGRGVGEAVGSAISHVAGGHEQALGFYKGFQGEQGGGRAGQSLGRGARALSSGVGSLASSAGEMASQINKKKQNPYFANYPKWNG